MTVRAPRNQKSDERILEALLVASSRAEAARLAGCSDCTIRRRLKDDDFKKRFRELRADVFEHSVARLQAATSEAIDALLEQLKSGTVESAKVAAARTILEMSLRTKEMFDMEIRILALEKRGNGLEGTEEPA